MELTDTQWTLLEQLEAHDAYVPVDEWEGSDYEVFHTKNLTQKWAELGGKHRTEIMPRGIIALREHKIATLEARLAIAVNALLDVKDLVVMDGTEQDNVDMLRNVASEALSQIDDGDKLESENAR